MTPLTIHQLFDRRGGYATLDHCEDCGSRLDCGICHSCEPATEEEDHENFD